MLIYDYMIDLLADLEENKKEETFEQERLSLSLENIRPEDLPPNDGPFPQKMPNKRVIIIDI